MNYIYRTALTVILLLIFSRVPLSAEKFRHEDRYRPSHDLIDVDIIGDERGCLSKSHAYRDNAVFVEARGGERFSIRVQNNSHERIALAISVDGRNIISGEKSYNGNNERMYVLNPGQTGNFDGWRSSYSQVQRFYFTSAGDSYAGRHGDYSQIGQIRIAAYREKTCYCDDDIYLKNRDGGPYRRSSIRESRAGTGYGEGSYSPTRRTEFDAEDHAAQTVTIRYNWPQKRHFHGFENSSFNGGFAPPPPRFRWN
jgi:hypothetical protein